jgi:hypothetical protein
MAGKPKNISRAEAEHFVILYRELGTYQAVAKITGRSASAVAKWVKILLAENTIKIV